MTTRSPARITAWSFARLAIAALITTAIIAQFAVTMNTTVAENRDVATVLANFFSFFTILSNCSAAIALALSGVWGLMRGRSNQEPRWLSVFLVSATTYMLLTGIVYNVLLRGYELPQGSTVWWANEILHLVGPALLLVDLFVAAPRRAQPWRTVLTILLFPMLWIVYTMIRGQLVTNPNTGDAWWYPYPFLNPYVTPGGYAGVAAYVLGIALAVAAIAFVVVWLTRRFASDPPLRMTTYPADASTSPPVR